MKASPSRSAHNRCQLGLQPRAAQPMVVPRCLHRGHSCTLRFREHFGADYVRALTTHHQAALAQAQRLFHIPQLPSLGVKVHGRRQQAAILVHVHGLAALTVGAEWRPQSREIADALAYPRRHHHSPLPMHAVPLPVAQRAPASRQVIHRQHCHLTPQLSSCCIPVRGHARLAETHWPAQVRARKVQA